MRALYKSECGGYLCRVTRCWGNFEAWSIDGLIHWRDDDRIKAWEDHELDWYPFEYCTGGFSAEKTGQKSGSFTVSLLRCDTQKIFIPWTGNTVIERREIVFRRKVAPQNYPKFLRPQPLKDDPEGRLADDGCRLAA